MNSIPVAGVDVSRKFSDMCILSPENDVFTRLKIYHDLTSMERASEALRDAEKKLGGKPIVVMESTSHYHLLLFQFFKESGYDVIVVNPIQSGALRNINVRKIKTDKADAYKIAMLYRMKVLRASQIPVDALRGLRALCRQHHELKCDITRYKNRLTALLDQVFPGYEKIFANVGTLASLAVLGAYPTPQILLLASPTELSELIWKTSRKSIAYGRNKAELLRNTAETALKLGIHAPADSALITAVVSILKMLLESVAQIDREIDALARQDAYLRETLSLLQTIPGIGPFSAAVILSEIGDFSLFQKPKQLAAYFGLDPSERQSGTFHGTKNKISKRGSHYVRSVLHMAAHNAVHPNRFGQFNNPVLAAFYQEKCKVKPSKVAICAVMHKLVNIIFAVLRDRKPFELRQPKEHAKRIGMLIAA